MTTTVRACTAVLAALALTLTACTGDTVTGEAKRAGIDVSALDVGNYPTKPRDIGNANDLKQARIREGQRLAEFVAQSFEIDDRFSFTSGGGFHPRIITDARALGGPGLIANDTFNKVAKDLVAGYVTMGQTTAKETDGSLLVNAVMMFPDEAAATTVAKQLENDDFTYIKTNQPVQISKFPTAHAHWQPNVASIGSWYAHKRYVFFSHVYDHVGKPDLPALTGLVEKTIAAQSRLVDEFEPTPADDLAKIPLDVDGILGRSLASDPKSKGGDIDGVWGPRAALNMMAKPVEAQKTFAEFGVDLTAFADGGVFRVKDQAAARRLFEKWSTPSDGESSADVPRGLEHDGVCFAPPNSEIRKVWRCNVTFGRYVAQVVALNQQEVAQKASAQYALLGAE